SKPKATNLAVITLAVLANKCGVPASSTTYNISNDEKSEM
ncbi:MAG: hypothetical protein ACI9LG_002805, partial [Moritella dasanensis]